MPAHNFKDLTGETFGRLTVISRAENDENGKAQWHCKCSCKNETIITVRGTDLKNGHTQSCGCLMREKNVELHTRHGKRYTKIYKVWLVLKDRCTNPNNKDYPRYGGRGIKLFAEWEEFPPFYDYVSQLEHFNEDGYSLDRIDNDGNYEPGNLRFATATEQGRNKRNNILVEYEGEIITLPEAAELIGIKYNTLKRRYYRGKRGEELFKK